MEEEQGDGEQEQRERETAQDARREFTRTHVDGSRGTVLAGAAVRRRRGRRRRTAAWMRMEQLTVLTVVGHENDHGWLARVVEFFLFLLS